MAQIDRRKLAEDIAKRETMKSEKKTTYISSGQAMTSPLGTVQLSRAWDTVYIFVALYLTTLFSLNSWTAARDSPFSNGHREEYRTGGRGLSDVERRGQRFGRLDTSGGGPNMPAPVKCCG